MRFVLIAAVLLAAPAYAQQPDPRGRPMHEMQGDCANYKIALAREFALWQQPAVMLDAVSAGTPATGTLQPDRRTEVKLLPAPQVRFAVPPSEDRGAPDRFSGSVPLASIPAGQWRVSASGGAWIDIAAETHLLAAPSFEMQTKCPSIFKSVTFIVPPGIVPPGIVPAGAKLTLQLNGSAKPTIEVLLTRLEK